MIKVKSKKELYNLIQERINRFGYECNLNDIDVSNVEDMSWLFYNSKFNGDISDWNVSNVTNMLRIFEKSEFNGDISKWNISNVIDMQYMFYDSKFNQNINTWKLNKKCQYTSNENIRPFKNLILTNKLNQL